MGLGFGFNMNSSIIYDVNVWLDSIFLVDGRKTKKAKINSAVSNRNRIIYY